MTDQQAANWNAAAQNVMQAGQVIAQGKTNKKTRKWNEKMYARQRADALADWNMQNAYNTPAAQMDRFKAAGLNPNLIYGQSNEAGVVRSTDVKSWNPQTPDIAGMSKGMDRYFDAQMKSATINNLRAQNENIMAQKELIEAQTQGVYKNMEDKDSQMGLRDWSLTEKKGLFPGSLEMQDWKIRHSMKDMDIKTQRHEMDLLQRAQSLEKGVVQIVNLRLDSALKKLDMALKDGAITQQVYDREYTKIKMTREYATEQYIHEQRRHMETTNQFRHQWRSEDFGLKLADEITDAFKLGRR